MSDTRPPMGPDRKRSGGSIGLIIAIVVIAALLLWYFLARGGDEAVVDTDAAVVTEDAGADAAVVEEVPIDGTAEEIDGTEAGEAEPEAEPAN